MRYLALLTLALLGTVATCSDNPPRPDVCIATIKNVTNTLYDIAFELYTHQEFPSYKPFQRLLDDVQTFIWDCLEKPYQVARYKACTPQFVGIYGIIRKTVEDIQERDTKATILGFYRIYKTFIDARDRCRMLGPEAVSV